MFKPHKPIQKMRALMRTHVHKKDLYFLLIFFGAKFDNKEPSLNIENIIETFRNEGASSTNATSTDVNNEIKLTEQKTSQKSTVNTYVNTQKTASEKSVYIYDVTNNKVILSENEDFLLPLASMTKIMTAIIALEKLSPDKIVTIDQSALNTFGDSGLKLEEKWKAGDLVKFMLVSSSNDAATALKNEVNKDQLNFITLMNQKAKFLGLNDTLFINETGLDQSTTTGGSYGSARDIAKLMEYAIENFGSFFEPTRYKEYNLVSESGISHKLQNTNTVVESIQNVIASKTGYTGLAGGNLVFAFDAGDNHLVIISLFGSTKEGRFEDAKKYIDIAIKEINLNK